MKCDRLFALLTAYRGEGAFNQYRDVHAELDLPDGAAVRRHNQRCYLETFAGARFVLVGEAAGYAGCRFSGIPFTCEAQLVGPQRLDWTRGRAQDLARSSAAETTVVRTTTPLTERSIPPVKMTKVIPTALIRRNELFRNKFKKTCGLRMPSKKIAPTT